MRTVAVVATALVMLTGAATPPVTGSTAQPAVSVTTAERALTEQADRIHRGPEDTFTVRRFTRTPSGLTYAAFDRSYRGLPVLGGGVVVVLDASGRTLDTSVGLDQPLGPLPTTPTVTADAASTRAMVDGGSATRAPRLVVHATSLPRLAWETVVTGHRDKTPFQLHVFVDAQSGARFAQYDEVKAAEGEGAYYGKVPVGSRRWVSFEMIDPSRGMSETGYFPTKVALTDEDDRWNDGSPVYEKDGVDAHYGARQFWDMLKDRFGRNGVDGQGTTVPVLVRWDEVNAYFNNQEVALGHNVGNTRQLTAFDVVGHELGHAVDATTGMPPSAALESGALGEATGDIFGAMTEAHARHPADPPDFTVGEMVHIYGEGTGAFRFMYKPSLDGRSPDCYGSLPNVVHYAAGPANHFFYLLAAGSNPAGGPASPTCDGSTHAGLGIWQAGQIWYHAMQRKFDWDYGYSDMRRYTLQAAVDLYTGCAEYNAVKAAWNAISVPADRDPACR